MKKTLLLSVVASTMIMAGGDIAPVEPVVEAPAVVSGWNFSGNAVVYYQTADAFGFDLFDQDVSAADVGLQLRATNDNVIAGIGAGIELSGLATLGLEHSIVSNVMQLPSYDNLSGGWVSELYLTYGMGNTSFKLGRQELPKSLSPFAYTEDWNVLGNTFDAVLVVNTDLPNTTLVGAWVAKANLNAMPAVSGFSLSTALFGDGGVMNQFHNLNEQDGVFMLTAQNTSIENLTLTGSWYFASNFSPVDDLNIVWGDAQYNAGSFTVGIQGGSIMVDPLDDTTAFGAKVATTISDINVALAYSNVNDGTTGMFQVGGTTSALYTNTVLNQFTGGLLEHDSDKFVVSADMAALGGTISAAFGYTDSAFTDTTTELDLAYSTNITDSLAVTAAYVYADIDAINDSANVIRVIGSYKF